MSLDKLSISDERKEQLRDKVIDGSAIVHKRNRKMKDFCDMLLQDYCLKPTLAIIQIGECDASNRYVRNKKKVAGDVGIHYKHFVYDDDTSTESILQLIDDLNRDESIDGILMQLPTPDHIDERAILNAISPLKDVDGFHPTNVGALHAGLKPLGTMPCTAYGVIQLIKSTGEDIAGKKAVVLGRSNIVGRPVAALLEQENATVTVCHSMTPSAELALAVRSADIVVSAIGRANYLKRGLLGTNQTIIDVGINRDEDGHLCGDVFFQDAIVFAKYITPVPGGVGPMTVSCLMENVIRCAMRSEGIDQSELQF